jgi:hypothetical protein
MKSLTLSDIGEIAVRYVRARRVLHTEFEITDEQVSEVDALFGALEVAVEACGDRGGRAGAPAPAQGQRRGKRFRRAALAATTPRVEHPAPGPASRLSIAELLTVGIGVGVGLGLTLPSSSPGSTPNSADPTRCSVCRGSGGTRSHPDSFWVMCGHCGGTGSSP